MGARLYKTLTSLALGLWGASGENTDANNYRLGTSFSACGQFALCWPKKDGPPSPRWRGHDGLTACGLT